MNCYLLNTQYFPNLPMPVCKKTIAKSIKDTEDKPRESSQDKRDKIPFAQFFRNPAKQIEDDERDMKNEEESVCNFIKISGFPLSLKLEIRNG